jgi:hypothetical protein
MHTDTHWKIGASSAELLGVGAMVACLGHQLVGDLLMLPMALACQHGVGGAHPMVAHLGHQPVGDPVC